MRADLSDQRGSNFPVLFAENVAQVALIPFELHDITVLHLGHKVQYSLEPIGGRLFLAEQSRSNITHRV